jgi:hypothetical protein
MEHSGIQISDAPRAEHSGPPSNAEILLVVFIGLSFSSPADSKHVESQQVGGWNETTVNEAL